MRKTTLAFISTAVALFPVAALSQDTQNVLKNSPQDNYTGFAIEGENEAFQPVDKLTFSSCDSKDSRKVVFVSDSIPSTKERRVIITNVTNGEQNVNLLPYSYSDLEYEEDRISEKLELQMDYEVRFQTSEEDNDHNLTVSQGENQFKYEIIDTIEEKDRELEAIRDTGYFSATIEKIASPSFTSCFNSDLETPIQDSYYDPSPPSMETNDDRVRNSDAYKDAIERSNQQVIPDIPNYPSY